MNLNRLQYFDLLIASIEVMSKKGKYSTLPSGELQCLGFDPRDDARPDWDDHDQRQERIAVQGWYHFVKDMPSPLDKDELRDSANKAKGHALTKGNACVKAANEVSDGAYSEDVLIQQENKLLGQIRASCRTMYDKYMFYIQALKLESNNAGVASAMNSLQTAVGTLEDQCIKIVNRMNNVQPLAPGAAALPLASTGVTAPAEAAEAGQLLALNQPQQPQPQQQQQHVGSDMSVRPRVPVDPLPPPAGVSRGSANLVPMGNGDAPLHSTQVRGGAPNIRAPLTNQLSFDTIALDPVQPAFIDDRHGLPHLGRHDAHGGRGAGRRSGSPGGDNGTAAMLQSLMSQVASLSQAVAGMSMDRSSGNTSGVNQEVSMFNQTERWYEVDDNTDYYRLLPVPWNRVPGRFECEFSMGSFFKERIVPKLGKDIFDFKVFRAQFIKEVHDFMIDESMKLSLLRYAIDSSAHPQIDEIFTTSGQGRMGYRNVIGELEKIFSSRGDEVENSYATLMAYPVMNANQHDLLRRFQRDLRTYIDCSWHVCRYNVINYHSGFNYIGAKLSDALQASLTRWLKTENKVGSVLNLMEWLTDLVENTRIRVTQYAKLAPPVGAMASGSAPKPSVPKPRAQRTTWHFDNQNERFGNVHATHQEAFAPVDESSDLAGDGYAYASTGPAHGKSPSGAKPRQAQAPPVKDKVYPCVCCQKEHKLRKCPKYLAMSPPARRAFVAKHCCYNCLEVGHGVKDCYRQPMCFCSRKHHPSIHFSRSRHLQDPKSPKEEAFAAQYVEQEADSDDYDSEAFETVSDADESSDEEVTAITLQSSSTSTNSKVAIKSVPVLVKNHRTGTQYRVNAALDECSTVTLIDENLVDELGLDYVPDPKQINGVGGAKAGVSKGKVNLVLFSEASDFSTQVVARSLVNPVGGLKPVKYHQIRKPSRYANIQLPAPAPGPIRILIGADHADLLETTRPNNERLARYEPNILLTPFGYTCMGRFEYDSKYLNNPAAHHLVEADTEADDDEELSNFTCCFTQMESLCNQDDSPWFSFADETFASNRKVEPKAKNVGIFSPADSSLPAAGIKTMPKQSDLVDVSTELTTKDDYEILSETADVALSVTPTDCDEVSCVQGVTTQAISLLEPEADLDAQSATDIAAPVQLAASQVSAACSMEALGLDQPNMDTSHLSDSEVLAETNQLSNVLSTEVSELDKLNELEHLLERVWDQEALEAPDVPPDLTADEQFALDTMKSTRRLIKDVNGNERYEIGIPWKQNCPSFPRSNYYLIKKRSEVMQKSMLKSPEHKEQFRNILQQWEEAGYAVRVKNFDPNTYPPHNFLNLFPVIRETRTTSKMRIVSDASLKFQGGSLNDQILKGPNFMCKVSDVICRMRKERIALVSDIKEMFLQVKLIEQDQNYHMFLYPDSDTGEVLVWKFTSHTFGNTASPAVAMFCIKERAKELAIQNDAFKRVADTVVNSSIMDDMVDSVATVEEALDLVKKLKIVINSCGMSIHKWITNDPRVLKSIPESERAPTAIISDKLDPEGKLLIHKGLGMIWLPTGDSMDVITFMYKIEVPATWTKRQWLKTIAQVYDPTGLILPIIMRGRIKYQGCWIQGWTWDEPIPNKKFCELLTDWTESLKLLDDLKIPRPLKCSAEVSKVEYFIFTDASQHCYGGCMYARYTLTAGGYFCRLVGSKARVAAVKAPSIPRLELMGLVMGVGLAKQMCKNLGAEVTKCKFFTDSTNSLAWLHTKKALKTFVSNRVRKVLGSTTTDQWSHLPGEINIADLLSRGATAGELIDKVEWFNGPKFLYEPEEKWPKDQKSYIGKSALPEQRQEKLYGVVLNTDVNEAKINVSKPLIQSLISKYSSYEKLVKIVGFLKRFTQPRKRDPVKITCEFTRGSVYRSNRINYGQNLSIIRPIDSDEFLEVELLLIKAVQAEYFSETISKVLKNEDLLSKDPLFNLTPAVDDKGILRVNARLKDAKSLNYETKCPIILPKQSKLTTLIVRYYHEKLSHVGGPFTLFAELNQRFWIPGGIQLVKNLVGCCTICKKKNAKPTQQKMANLPDHRIPSGAMPWDTVAVDYCGPYLVRHGRKREKRWLAVFSCTAYRCIDIRVVFSLRSDSFIMTLENFIHDNRRPRVLILDNLPTYKGAEKEISQMRTHKLLDEFSHQLASRFPKVQFKYTPPYSPSQGGIFETTIKLTKNALSTVLSDGLFDDEQLINAVIKAKAFVNSRPLVAISSDFKDHPSALTPNHFLLKGVYSSLVPFAEKTSTLDKYAEVEKALNKFWHKFMKEVVPHYHKYQKWVKTKSPIKVGDVVISLEPTDRKDDRRWPLGRVLQVVPSEEPSQVADSQNRRFIIFFDAKNQKERGTLSLCPLIDS